MGSSDGRFAIPFGVSSPNAGQRGDFVKQAPLPRPYKPPEIESGLPEDATRKTKADPFRPAAYDYRPF